MSLQRLTKRLADLDAERARLIIAIDVWTAVAGTPDAASMPGQKLAARALAHMNGSTPARHDHIARDLALQELIVNWFERHPPGQLFSTADVHKGLNEKFSYGQLRPSLIGLTRATKIRRRFLKRRGSKRDTQWMRVGGEFRKATGKATRKATGKATKRGTGRRRQDPSPVMNEIIALLKSRAGDPLPFEAIRDDLRARGVIGKETTAGRTVSVILRTALVRRGLAKLTPNGWVHVGGD
jgi:hypothetical protein